MNVRTFLLGALCGAVVFSILDRLMEERERRLAVREAESPAADVRSQARPRELQPTVTPASIPEPAEQSVASAGASEIEDPVIAEQPAGKLGPSAQSPRLATETDADVRGDAKESKSDEDDSSDEGAPASAAQSHDETWGPFMEQALRQFLASHRSAAQFDIQTIRCAANECEIRAIGFDQSTEPVWQQVIYDIRQQPWAEIGQAGSTWGLTEGRFVATAKLFRRPRQ